MTKEDAIGLLKENPPMADLLDGLSEDGILFSLTSMWAGLKPGNTNFKIDWISVWRTAHS